jgi:hypothetical protein
MDNQPSTTPARLAAEMIDLSMGIQRLASGVSELSIVINNLLMHYRSV